MSEALRECVSPLIRIRKSIKIKVHIEGKGKCRGIIFGIPFYLSADPLRMETEISRDGPIKHLWSTYIKGQHLRTVSISVHVTSPLRTHTLKLRNNVLI